VDSLVKPGNDNVIMNEILQLIDAQLDELLPAETDNPTLLHAAMRYSVFSGGKRIRPVLCVAVCEALGGSVQDALVASCAIEILHTYTLIHDDLPAMDDDDMRRGKPSCHKKFNEATAILAGDALLTLAFEWLGGTGNVQPVVDLARASGSLGIIAGQQDDMTMKNSTPSKAQFLEMQRKKTAILFSVSCGIGARCAKAGNDQIAHAQLFGETLGRAFQLFDDLCDNDPVTMSVIGREETMKLAEKYKADSYNELSAFASEATQLRDIIDFTYSSFK